MENIRFGEEWEIELAQSARESLVQSGNCAQTTFAVLQKAFDLGGGDILRALTPFPGIALRGETCGAVVGSLMAVGLVYGRDDLTDWKGFTSALPPARSFCRQFEEAHGCTSCQGVLKEKLGKSFDLASREDAMAYAAAGGPQACGDVVASAVKIAARTIKRSV